MEFALYIDCLDLIENFVQHGNPSFKTFCTEWKKTQFQNVYALQTTNIEILNTTEAIFHVGKRTLCGRNINGELLLTPEADVLHTAMLRRIGGLYLIYAIYFKQPTLQYMKVSVSPKTWSEIQEFLKMLPKSMSAHNEILYIFWRLVQDKAFRFTALDFCVGLEKLVNYDKIAEGSKKNNDVDMNISFFKQDLTGINVMEKLLPALRKLENGYNNVKRQLVANETEGLNAKSLPMTTIFQDLQKTLNKIKHDIDETGDVEPVVSKKSKYEKNKSLKQGKVLTQREMEESRSKFHRLSAHTIFTEQLPNKVLNDLDAPTSPETQCSDSSSEDEDCNNPVALRGLEMLLDDFEEDSCDAGNAATKQSVSNALTENRAKQETDCNLTSAELEAQLKDFLTESEEE